MYEGVSRDENLNVPVLNLHLRRHPRATYRAVAAYDLLLRDASGGVQEVQCVCIRNRLLTLFLCCSNMLNGAQQRRSTSIAVLVHVGNGDRFLLFTNGASRFFSYLL